MKFSRTLIGAALLLVGYHAGAAETAKSASVMTIAESLNILQVAPCKASGDGTYTEMVTTMASVLPPAEADALLTRYCDECNRKKFAVAVPR